MLISSLAVILFSANALAFPNLLRRQASASARYVSGSGSEAPYAGATSADLYPPTGTTGGNTAQFPNESEIGYPGPTTTGAEPFVAETAIAFPVKAAPANLVLPASKPEIYKQWGNLSPWYTVNSSAYGLNNASLNAPAGCAITQVQLLYRHGARYPTTGSALSLFGAKLRNTTGFTASGPLSFLNDWQYLLGAEVLTPSGRQQNFDLGVEARYLYGHLLNNFTESGTLPVFRAQSQDRIVKTALNFAAGFFGIPYEDQFNLELIIEAPGFNNSGASYYDCPNANAAPGSVGSKAATTYANTTFVPIAQRLQSYLTGYTIKPLDVLSMFQLCSYETQALGYSAFCDLFTTDDFALYERYYDISFYYGNFMGSPVAAAQGKGLLTEFVARLTQTPITSSDSSLNSTLDSNPIDFPLNSSIYADATHEVIVCDTLAALNLTALAGDAIVPVDGSGNPTFVASQIVPFATHLTLQVLDCADRGRNIRFIVNDAVVPITNYPGCSSDPDGLCAFDTVVAALQQRIQDIDYNYACNGDYAVEAGIDYNGLPPKANATASSSASQSASASASA